MFLNIQIKIFSKMTFVDETLCTPSQSQLYHAWCDGAPFLIAY